MKKILSLLCVFYSVALAAQNVSGKVLDDKGAPIGFANVTLLKSSDSSLHVAGITGKDGSYLLTASAPGRYFIRVTSIGFVQKDSAPFEVGETGTREIGSMVLQQERKTLEEVSVLALRPTIVQQADRLVVSVEGTAMAAGNTAYAVLARAPGVFIDPEGNIQLNGRSGVTVMLDGKLTYLSARDLRTLLEGMPAENLKNIEIITNPSAKFDAEGTSGILNINLKKNTLQGMNGSLYAGYNYNFKQHAWSAGGNINYKKGRWNSFINIDAARRAGGREATFTRVFYDTAKTTYFDQEATGNFVVQGPPTGRAGTEYTLNSRHSIGAMAAFNRNTGDFDFLTQTNIGAAPKTPYTYVAADNYTHNTFSNFTTNLHYGKKWDTLGTLLTADLDYAHITNRGYSNYYNYFTDLGSSQKSQDLLYASTPNGYDIYSAKVDYTRPFGKDHKIETGGRISRVQSDNDFRFYFNNGALVLDPSRTNHFRFREKIYAAYVNWSGPISKKITAQAGLRMEHTASLGESFTVGKRTPRKYTNFFPSVFLQQKVSENYGINYSYSYRITRPNYGNLNPFRAYRDPYTWYQGNTTLRPQYTHSLSIAQSFRKIYILTLSYQLNKDVMAEIPLLDVTTATTVYTTGNVDDGHNLGLTALAPLKIMKGWESQNTVLLSYNRFSMMSNFGQVVNQQMLFMIQSNHTMQLPKSVRMELNLLYRGPSASGLYQMASMHRVDLAFRKSIWKKKLDLSLNANDLFKGYRFLWTTDIGGNVNEFDQYFRFRNIGLTLRFNFSKGQKVEERRRTTVEELNRT